MNDYFRRVLKRKIDIYIKQINNVCIVWDKVRTKLEHKTLYR